MVSQSCPPVLSCPPSHPCCHGHLVLSPARRLAILSPGPTTNLHTNLSMFTCTVLRPRVFVPSRPHRLKLASPSCTCAASQPRCPASSQLCRPAACPRVPLHPALSCPSTYGTTRVHVWACASSRPRRLASYRAHSHPHVPPRALSLSSGPASRGFTSSGLLGAFASLQSRTPLPRTFSV